MNLVPYGLPINYGASRLEEALQVIRLCLDSTGAPLNFEGKFFQLRDAVFDLKAPKGRQPQVWVGALGPRMLELTGRYGDGWYPLGMMSADEYGEKLAAIQAAARAAGRDPAAVLPTLQPYMVVAPTSEEATALLQHKTIRYFGLLTPAEQWRKMGFSHPFGEEFRGFLDFLPEQHTRSELDEAIAHVPDELAGVGLFVGSPAEIARQLRPFVERGMRYVVPQAMTAAISRKHALYSLRAVRAIGKALNE
jgi:phthiodiolone/phenolphthiodiolone dimycocerosates ketoreductase